MYELPSWKLQYSCDTAVLQHAREPPIYRARGILIISIGSDCHSPVFPNRSRFSNTVHTNLVSIQTAGKQADKNILPICTHFALLESPMQLEIMHGGKFSDRALLIARSIRCILADQRSRWWWPPSCPAWCRSTPSIAVYTDLASFYDDAATSP